MNAIIALQVFFLVLLDISARMNGLPSALFRRPLSLARLSLLGAGLIVLFGLQYWFIPRVDDGAAIFALYVAPILWYGAVYTYHKRLWRNTQK